MYGHPNKSLVIDTWAGRRYYAVELVGETPKKARIRVLTPGGVMLPGRRYVNYGETFLVPKHAIVDLPKDAHKVEQGYYDGHINGYAGVFDSRVSGTTEAEALEALHNVRD